MREIVEGNSNDIYDFNQADIGSPDIGSNGLKSAVCQYEEFSELFGNATKISKNSSEIIYFRISKTNKK